MKKIVKLTESDLVHLVNKVISENDGYGKLNSEGTMDEQAEEGFGLMKSKGEMEEQMVDRLETRGSTPNKSQSNGPNTQFINFLKQQGFKDWSGGKSYGMNFHYISRKPTIPANLTLVVGQDKNDAPGTCDMDIMFDEKIEKAERYKNSAEYEAKSAIPKIEKLLGQVFDMREKGGGKLTFYVNAPGLPFEKAKQVIILFNQIRLKGPYGGVN